MSSEAGLPVSFLPLPHVEIALTHISMYRRSTLCSRRPSLQNDCQRTRSINCQTWLNVFSRFVVVPSLLARLHGLIYQLPCITQHDTHIISILYKTHRSLSPKSTQKINSLYTFNALATTAKTMVDKGVARKGDANAELGAGFATGFLNKMEGVLEGLVSDMADGWTEGQVSGFFFSR